MNLLTGFLILAAGAAFGYIFGAIFSIHKPNREDLDEQYRQFAAKDASQGKSDKERG